MKEDKKILHFELLGSFSCENMEGRRAGDRGTALKAGRKALSFLQYLVVNHDRSISSEELIEAFWTERSQAPANALRNMLFKVRNLLKNIYPEYDDLLQTFPGCYGWNPDICLELDTEQFEAACLEARKKSKEEHLELLLQAIALYKGDLLPANDSDWVITLRQYYRASYLDACKTVLPLLYKKEDWMGILGVCEQAYRIDFSAEEFTIYQMQALIAMGQPEEAMKRYEAFRAKIFEEFRISPGSRVEQLYTLASGLRKKNIGISDVFRAICEGDSNQSAFFCTFDIFQNIVALERRHLVRSGQKSTLAIISLGDKAVPGADMRRLERVLLEQLRAGDPVARLEAGSYIVMLTGTDVKNAQIVINRIEYMFRKTYRRSKASLACHIAEVPLE